MSLTLNSSLACDWNISLFISFDIGSYFNPVQLAEIAHRLDEAEKEHLTSGSDITKAEYKRIMEVLIISRQS